LSLLFIYLDIVHSLLLREKRFLWEREEKNNVLILGLKKDVSETWLDFLLSLSLVP